jgi:predicted esterase YcpF (UPF0227 family)
MLLNSSGRSGEFFLDDPKLNINICWDMLKENGWKPMVIDAAKTCHHEIADRIRPLMQSASVDRIYYCHGFASHFDSNKDKVRALNVAAIVDGNTVDYTLPPHKVFESFQKAMSARRKYLFVGTSMGGFFAAWLGTELGFPYVAINPAVTPSHSLRKYIGAGVTHYGTRFTLREETVEAYSALQFRMDGQGLVALDMGDKVIDPQKTLQVVGDTSPVLAFQGGSHRFDHMNRLATIIRSIFFRPFISS